MLACHAGHKRFYDDVHKTLDCIEIIDELVPKPEDVVNGANVLLQAILALDDAAWT